MKKFFLFVAVMVVSVFGTFAQGDAETYAKTVKEIAEGNATYSKLESVKDISGLATDAIIPEAKKLATSEGKITRNFSVKVPIDIVSYSLDGDKFAVDPKKDFVTLELINFGELGNTVLISLDFGSANFQSTISTSGKNVCLGPTTQGGNEFIAIVRNLTQNGAVGALVRVENKWFLQMISKDGIVSSFHRGMKRSEVEKVCGVLGLSSFKETGKTAQYTICSLYWLDMNKQYDVFGNYNYQMRNDKKYGDFYFDANGRLMKWFLFM